MYALFFFEFVLHACSLLTAVIVLLKINRYDKIELAAKICISTIYSSVFLSDISYSYAVYIKCLRNQLTFNYNDVITTEPNPIHQAIFCHEMGTWVYVWGVILTAIERLINSMNCRLQLSFSVFLVLSPLLILVIFGTSYFCTSLLLSADHQQKADVLIGASQIFGVSALMYTLYRNQKNYRNGVGQNLERRYQDAYVYKFNRSVLFSLVGEVIFRAAGFACVLAITTVPVRDQPAFGWTSFAYHNIIPVGSIVCPWIIVLRHVNLRQVLGRRQCRNVAVADLNGRSLAMRESTDEHFASLKKAWKEKAPR